MGAVKLKCRTVEGQVHELDELVRRSRIGPEEMESILMENEELRAEWRRFNRGRKYR